MQLRATLACSRCWCHFTGAGFLVLMCVQCSCRSRQPAEHCSEVVADEPLFIRVHLRKEAPQQLAAPEPMQLSGRSLWPNPRLQGPVVLSDLEEAHRPVLVVAALAAHVIQPHTALDLEILALVEVKPDSSSSGQDSFSLPPSSHLSRTLNPRGPRAHIAAAATPPKDSSNSGPQLCVCTPGRLNNSGKTGQVPRPGPRAPGASSSKRRPKEF